MRLILAMVLAGLAALPLSVSAQAETDSVVVSPGRLELAQPSELQRRLANLEAAYQDANVRKPRAGIAVSVMVMAGGVIAVVAGAVFNSGLGTPTERSDRLGSALILTGSITMAVGAGGLAFSGVRLKRAKRERRRLEPEIESLRSTLDR